jgi:Arc/MetJ-type ribon-helix-helix transcriptional regulator
MTPQKTFTFTLPDGLKVGLQTVKERDGISEAEQIRRAIRLWLEGRGVKVKAERKRAVARKRP